MRGGSRNRSGPKADPTSGRSERRGYTLQTLPAEGYTGPIPAFPLKRYNFLMADTDGNPIVDERSSRAFRAAEIELWRSVWRSPQGAAWHMQQNHWRWRIVANYVRHSVRCASPNAPASLLGQIHRFADQIGMTDAGLQAMGWAIVPAESTQQEKPAGKREPATRTTSGGARTRLTVVSGGG